MLKKLFISVFPEIEKISQHLGLKLAKNDEKLNIWWKGASDPQNLTQSFFPFSQDITMLKKLFISVFPEIEKISQHLGLSLGQKWWKIESLMKRSIGSAKPHRTVFHFVARYYDAEEVIHKRISWNWENTSKSGPKLRSIIMKNCILMKRCIGSAKPHTIVFPFFVRYYDAEEVIHKRISWNWENISKHLGLNLGQIWWKIEYLMKRCIGSAKPHTIVFRFFARYYDAEEVIHNRICLKLRKYLKSGPKLCQ